MPPYETRKLACESDIEGSAPVFPCGLITFAPLIPRAYISEKAMNDSGCKITKMLEEGKPGLNLTAYHSHEGRTQAINSGISTLISFRSVRSVVILRSLSSVVILRSLRGPLFSPKPCAPSGRAHVRQNRYTDSR